VDASPCDVTSRFVLRDGVLSTLFYRLTSEGGFSLSRRKDYSRQVPDAQSLVAPERQQAYLSMRLLFKPCSGLLKSARRYAVTHLEKMDENAGLLTALLQRLIDSAYFTARFNA